MQVTATPRAERRYEVVFSRNHRHVYAYSKRRTDLASTKDGTAMATTTASRPAVLTACPAGSDPMAVPDPNGPRPVAAGYNGNAPAAYRFILDRLLDARTGETRRRRGRCRTSGGWFWVTHVYPAVERARRDVS